MMVGSGFAGTAALRSDTGLSTIRHIDLDCQGNAAQGIDQATPVSNLLMRNRVRNASDRGVNWTSNTTVLSIGNYWVNNKHGMWVDSTARGFTSVMDVFEASGTHGLFARDAYDVSLISPWFEANAASAGYFDSVDGLQIDSAQVVHQGTGNAFVFVNAAGSPSIQTPTFDDVGSGKQLISNPAGVPIKIDNPHLQSGTIGGSHIVRDGVGENSGDPSTTGQWNGNGYEGAIVVDTTNLNVYHYRGGAWV